jgi:hypothetical protein
LGSAGIAVEFLASPEVDCRELVQSSCQTDENIIYASFSVTCVCTRYVAF